MENINRRTRSRSEGKRNSRARVSRKRAATDREQYLAKNRAAANKSRKKKKEWMQELEDDLEMKRVQNSSLRGAVDFLRRERASVKTMCLQHLDCDCSDIRTYMRSSLESHLASLSQSGWFMPDDSPDFERLITANKLENRESASGNRSMGFEHGYDTLSDENTNYFLSDLGRQDEKLRLSSSYEPENSLTEYIPRELKG